MKQIHQADKWNVNVHQLLRDSRGDFLFKGEFFHIEACGRTFIEMQYQPFANNMRAIYKDPKGELVECQVLYPNTVIKKLVNNARWLIADINENIDKLMIYGI